MQRDFEKNWKCNAETLAYSHGSSKHAVGILFPWMYSKGRAIADVLGGGGDTKAQKLQNGHKRAEDTSEQIILNWHQ